MCDVTLFLLLFSLYLRSSSQSLSFLSPITFLPLIPSTVLTTFHYLLFFVISANNSSLFFCFFSVVSCFDTTHYYSFFASSFPVRLKIGTNTYIWLYPSTKTHMYLVYNSIGLANFLSQGLVSVTSCPFSLCITHTTHLYHWSCNAHGEKKNWTLMEERNLKNEFIATKAFERVFLSLRMTGTEVHELYISDESLFFLSLQGLILVSCTSHLGCLVLVRYTLPFSTVFKINMPHVSNIPVKATIKFESEKLFIRGFSKNPPFLKHVLTFLFHIIHLCFGILTLWLLTQDNFGFFMGCPNCRIISSLCTFVHPPLHMVLGAEWAGSILFKYSHDLSLHFSVSVTVLCFISFLLVFFVLVSCFLLFSLLLVSILNLAPTITHTKLNHQQLAQPINSSCLNLTPQTCFTLTGENSFLELLLTSSLTLTFSLFVVSFTHLLVISFHFFSSLPSCFLISFYMHEMKLPPFPFFFFWGGGGGGAGKPSFSSFCFKKKDKTGFCPPLIFNTSSDQLCQLTVVDPVGSSIYTTGAHFDRRCRPADAMIPSTSNSCSELDWPLDVTIQGEHPICRQNVTEDGVLRYQQHGVSLALPSVSQGYLCDRKMKAHLLLLRHLNGRKEWRRFSSRSRSQKLQAIRPLHLIHPQGAITVVCPVTQDKFYHIHPEIALISLILPSVYLKIKENHIFL
ncbi:putative signal peptide protein [Puccinia sorghi]|uniref:Putative signal peptide protein n=1 Tax=Puccinia sorghi TaxID=27349 RepID=A0A0L6U9Q5_9BASI|nr:putative signal peptide protein [Puccinia sorghi]